MNVTADKFIGGRVIVRQMESGFRSGLDAVMLAASIPAGPGSTVTLIDAVSSAPRAAICVTT